MDLITLIVILVVVGVLMWFVNVKIPMDRNIKWLLNAVVIVFLVIWLLRVFNIAIPNIRI